MTVIDPAGLSQAPEPPALDGSLAPPAGPSRRTRWLSAAGAVGMCTAGLAALYLVNPNLPDNPYPPCLFKATTGLDCPGCGGTRAMYALLHGDFAAAADHHLLIFVIAPLLAYLVVRFILDQFDVRLPRFRMRRSLAWLAVGVIGVFSVVRNLPFEPLTYLGSGLS